MMTGSCIARNLAQQAPGGGPERAPCHAGLRGANLSSRRSQRRGDMSMSVGVLDHYNVSTRKLRDTVRCCEQNLGLVNGPRPPFNFPGAWLYSEGRPVLHLNDISQTDRQQREDSGGIDHVAFGSRGFEAMKKHLAGKGIPHRVNQVPNSTRCQIFLRDPNNVEIELNYDTKDERAA